MHLLLSFLKLGSIGYSLGIVQWDFTRRDHPGNPGKVSGSGLVKKHQDNMFQFISTLNCKITSNIYIQIENYEKPSKGRKYKGKKMNKMVQIEKVI